MSSVNPVGRPQVADVRRSLGLTRELDGAVRSYAAQRGWPLSRALRELVGLGLAAAHHLSGMIDSDAARSAHSE